MTPAVLLIAGLVTLYIGAEALIRGGTGLALSMNIRPILIGLTVVAFGTSLPELTVALLSTVKETQRLAFGNIIGSNICNILLIFGVMAVIRPIRIEEDNLRKDIPAVLGSCGLLWILAADGFLNGLDGIILLLAFMLFLIYLWKDRKTRFAHSIEPTPKHNRILYLLIMPVGLALLIFGGWACVRGGTGIAEMLGVPQYIIGLTIIAIGTSLPELAIGVVASIKGHSDIPIGNALGSNIFNALGIVGVAAVIKPISINIEMLHFSLPVMLATSAAFLPLAKSGKKLTRLEGAGFLIAYSIYLAALYVSR